MNIEKDNLEEMMENLELPDVEVAQHQKEFRLTLLNTKKSAITGAILLVLPLLFLSGVILKHYLHLDFGIFTAVYNWIGRMDRQYGDSSILNWVIRTLLTLGPLTAIGLNLLSVIHFRIEKAQKEIVFSIKLKWLNWLIIFLCAAIFVVFFLYLIVENA
ncbi:MAG TPA: hypothetical protein VKN36_13555 [Eudoraea sp.]|nr:hypothetical protein [Eudoraea sp.]